MDSQMKVIRILSDSRIIVNAGSLAGVCPGMKLAIYDNSDILIDPDTKETLGLIYADKATMVPEVIDEQFSICLLDSTVRGQDVLGFNMIAKSLEVRPPVNPEQIDPIGHKSKEINVGDSVRFR